MTRREYCHRLADIDEALYDTKNELKKVRSKIIMEDDPGRKEWFMGAQERLLQEKEDLENERERFVSENHSTLDD